jgi:hypothetical protein
MVAGEEFQEPARRVLAGVSDDRRHGRAGQRRGDGSARPGDGQLAVGIRVGVGHGFRVT